VSRGSPFASVEVKVTTTAVEDPLSAPRRSPAGQNHGTDDLGRELLSVEKQRPEGVMPSELLIRIGDGPWTAFLQQAVKGAGPMHPPFSGSPAPRLPAAENPGFHYVTRYKHFSTGGPQRPSYLRRCLSLNIPCSLTPQEGDEQTRAGAVVGFVETAKA
jgi:hypothetical protein